MLGVSRDPQKNQSYRNSSTCREAEVAMGGAHSSEKGWTLSSQGASAALVDPQRGRQTTLSTSQLASGHKWHKTVLFGTPYLCSAVDFCR
ncbi:jg23383 [Pararge aegeria aegeria]|uniref:Jg23383 protein n=1 Tax=Pararge aegeria aegeria TaxID=348720 RepID=A0A8S4RHP9_9NEOP|nr:jg23383 [Pararge aegeria aegeria]